MASSDDEEEPIDLDAELDALDVDKDFSLWTSFRSRRSIASSASASEDRDLDLSLVSSDEQTNTSIHSANQVELDDFEYWRIRRYMRDEVYSPKYKPSASEEKEFQELLTFLGMNRKKMFEKQDETWNELSTKTNIVMKRGPILLNGQERELVLLSHGFVLAQVQEASSKTPFARLMIARTYEQCELYNAIEYVRSVPVMENVIMEVEEEEENEEKGVEVEMNAGETVVVEEEVVEEGEPPTEQNVVVAIRIGSLTKSSSSSFEDDASSNTSSDESVEKDTTVKVDKDDDDDDDESVKEEVSTSLDEVKPETKSNENVDEAEKKDDNEIPDSHDNDNEESAQEDTSGSNEGANDDESSDEEAEASEIVADDDDEQVKQADTNDSAEEVKQVVTIDLDDASVESGSEADKKAKEILEENDIKNSKPESAPSSPATSPQRRPFLGMFGGRKNDSETIEEPKDDVGSESEGSEDDDDDSKGDEEEKLPSASESSADRRQFLGLFGGRKKLSDTNVEAKGSEEGGSKDENEDNVDAPTKDEENDGSPNEATSPVASPEKRSFMGIFGSPTSSPEKHVTIQTPPKKKQVTIQEERYRFEIKTEKDEFNFECATKLHEEAWVEALERVLVKTRSRSRSNKDRVRGWQHVLVQTSLYSAAVTGLDELCRTEWLDAVNELDKYNSLSALHYAVMNNMMHIMDWLLRNGADPETKDEDERTPMYYAQRDELTGAQALLLDYGATRSQLQDVEERGALFQGAAQVAEEKLAAKSAPMNGISKRKTGHDDGKPSSEGDLKSHQHAATKAHGAMADAMNELRIRGEKINDLAEKANDLEENVNTYGDLAKQMKARAKKKKWYNLK